MAKAQRRSGWTKWISHRTLVSVEVVLVVGAANQAIGAMVVEQAGLPNWGKTLFTMAGVVGVFGLLFAVINALAAYGVGGTHKAVKAMPVPLPGIVIHLAIFVGLFLLYAWLWKFLPLWHSSSQH